MEENLQSETETRAADKRLYVYIVIKGLVTLLISISVILFFIHIGDASVLVENFFMEIKESGAVGLALTTIVVSLLITVSIPMEPILIPMAFFLSRIYGVYVGGFLTLLISFSAVQVSSLFSVLIIRLFLARYVHEYIIFKDLYSMINMAAREKGVLLVFVLRLTPLVPFSLSNCILGLTEVSYLSLFAGNFGSLPTQAVLILLGTSISNIQSLESKAGLFNMNPKHSLILATMTLISLVALLYLFIEYYRKIRINGYPALQKETDPSRVVPLLSIDSV